MLLRLENVVLAVQLAHVVVNKAFVNRLEDGKLFERLNTVVAFKPVTLLHYFYAFAVVSVKQPVRF